MDWLFSIAGLVVGLLVGMTGVGGGAMMTPLLILGFNISPLIAVGTDLLFAAATKTVGTIAHGWQGSIQWRLVALLSAGSLPATFATLHFLAELQSHVQQLESVIRFTLAIALFLTAFLLLFKNKLTASIKTYPAKSNPYLIAVLTVIAGVVLGVLVTISSIGAGAIGIVVLSLLYPKMETTKIIGTDIAHAVPLTLLAGIGHFQLGSVDFGLLFWLLLGSIPGVYFGSRMSQLLPEKVVRFVLASILFGVSLNLIN